MTFGTLSLLLPLAAANPTLPGPVGPGCGPSGCPVPTPMLPPNGFCGLEHMSPVPPRPDPCRPIGPPAPLLAAKIIPPAGVRVTFLPGTPEAAVFTEPAVIGFRPGYSYRVELSELPGQPGLSLYPEIEVRGSLVPRLGMNPMDYPAAIVFTAADIERAAAGAMVTKVIYLEDPVLATPVTAHPDRPIERGAFSEAEAIRNALDLGRLVMIVRMGNRPPDENDLQAGTVPGTVLLPGMKHLGTPPVPPRIPFCGVMLYDPILGPKFPHEECLPDGGDVGPRLGIGPLGRLAGLNPTDVAVEYTQANRRKVTTSNRVCVCVPRFAVQRAEIAPGGLRLAISLESGSQAYGGASLQSRNAAQAVFDRLKPVGFDSRLRTQMQVGVQGLHVLIGPPTRPMAVAISEGVQVVASYIAPEETTNFNEFVVTKSIEPDAEVKIGDEVTITIRYANHSRLPVSEIVVSDSLTARLEYVPGSSESDRPANVTTEVNEVGSVIVRFDIPGVVQPGQGGVVRFRAKVR
jgi:uncharacterized repeat protein (TIGR01451 family)